MKPALRLFLAAAALALFAVLALDPAGRALAQETELPGVSADSVQGDFLKGPAVELEPPAAPGTVPVPRAPEDERTQAFRRKIHASDNDVVQVGHDVVIERGQHVLGHVITMGGNITVRGIVDDDVVAMGGDVTVDDGAIVRGDAVSLGGQVHKGKSATVLGSNVTVGGLPKQVFDFQGLGLIGNGFKFVARLIKLVFWLFVGWIVVLAVPDRSRRVLDEVFARPAVSILWGFIGLLAIVPLTVAVALVAVLLVVTIIGIPVAVLLLLGYVFALCAALVWSGVLGGAWIGTWLIRRLSPRLGEPTLVRATLIGIAAVGVLGLIGTLFNALGMVIPPAGLLGKLIRFVVAVVQCVATLAGLGGLVLAKAGQVAPLRMPWGAPRTVAAPPAPPAPPEAPAAPL